MKKVAFVVAVPSNANAAPFFTRAYPRQIARCAKETMRRKLVWIEQQHLWGWGCSECEWVFNLSGSPVGKSLDEMIQNYEQGRDKDFATHVCSEHPRAKKTKG